MRLIEARPGISQREMATELGVSLGKTNYCLRALIGKGFVKASNFRNSEKKTGYLYMLTPAGIERKAALTVAFLARKRKEYEALRHEIETLSQEVDSE